MLVLSRKKHERICIGNDVVVTVIEIHGNQVRLGVEAPKDTAVHRHEVVDKIRKQKQPTCQHEWLSAVNSVVKSGEVCPKCGAVRA
jgi:carbon storage regulator